MAKIVEGKEYFDLDGQLSEIKRQLRQKNGYPFDPIMLQRHLQSAIEGRFSGAMIPGRFFMTVTLGIYSNVIPLSQAILSSGKKISDYAGQILEKIEISSREVDVDLWEVSGAELGFTEAVSRSAIYQRAIEFGFDICPAEAIALSRIKCGDKKRRVGGMEPAPDSDGVLNLLNLNSGSDSLWLNTHYDSPVNLWSPDDVWVFARSRRK